jgi:preprotein translocase subunit YajC
MVFYLPEKARQPITRDNSKWNSWKEGNMNKTKWHSKVIHLVVALALVLILSLATAVSALAAPAVTSVTETAFGTDTTNHYVDMPATVNAGDLLIVLFTNDGNATVTTPGGWTQLASTANGSAVRLSAYYKIASGTEGGTMVNFATSAVEQAAAQVYRITNWNGTTPPEISTAATGTSTAPNPASLNPAGWDVADTLWIAVAGQDRGDQSGTTAYPAYYTDGISTLSNISGTSQCRTHSARRVLAAASENPGAFTIPVAEEWVAFTIAVRPAPRDLTTSSTTGGSVIEPGEGVYTYDEGTVVDLVAEADESYRFVEWTGDVGTITDVHASTTTITMNGDYSITAEFVAIYDLSISSTGGGSVTEPGEGVFTYDNETVVDLAAEPADGYRFVEWTGDVGTIADVYDATTTITMNGDYSITAEFARQYDLTTSSTEGGSVTEPGEGVFTYDEGTVVDLVAEPADGYRFVEWTGDVGTIADVYDATTTITMNGDYSITAEFVTIYDLSISSTEGGSVTTPGEGVFTYDEGEVIDLLAEAEEDYLFVEWTGDVGTIADVYAASTTITMNGDYTITANFEPVYPTVTTQAATNITAYSSTLNMNYTVGDFSPVQVRFAYKKSTGLFWSYTNWISKSKSGTHAELLTGLDSDTEYDFVAQLKHNEIEVEGTILQFTTDIPPTPSPFGGCFIATAAYGTPTAEQIDVLCEFRDVVLLESTVGSQFVAWYYQLSPPVADFISGNELLRTLVRELLVDPIVWVVEVTEDIWRN